MVKNILLEVKRCLRARHTGCVCIRCIFSHVLQCYSLWQTLKPKVKKAVKFGTILGKSLNFCFAKYGVSISNPLGHQQFKLTHETKYDILESNKINLVFLSVQPD